MGSEPKIRDSHDKWTLRLAAATLLMVTIYTGIAAWQARLTLRSLALTEVSLAQTRNVLAATVRPWIVIADFPDVTAAQNGDAISLSLSVKYKPQGQSPAGNGMVAAFVLADIEGANPTDYVKRTTDLRPDCPKETRPDEWIPFNTNSKAPQTVPATGRNITIEKSPYVLICARYEWSLDRSQSGRVIMLYRLEGVAQKNVLRLLASYAG